MRYFNDLLYAMQQELFYASVSVDDSMFITAHKIN